MFKLATTLTLTATVLGTAQAAEVRVDRTLNAPIEQVWESFSTFCSIQSWQSLVNTCDVYENRHGIHRTIVMNDGGIFIERLSEFSDSRHSYTYTIVTGPLGLKNYQANLDFDSRQAKRTHLTWRANFDIDQELEQEMTETLTLLFNNGIDGMEETLKEARHGNSHHKYPKHRKIRRAIKPNRKGVTK